MAQKSMMINNMEVFFELGDTILDVAENNNIKIPTLCHMKDTIPTGICRICVVEVEGFQKFFPVCPTPAEEKMVL